MSVPGGPSGQQKYYDPAEVDAYVADVTKTIKTLQARLKDAERRADLADLAEQRDQVAQAAGRAGTDGVNQARRADQTVAEAEDRAAAIVRAAEDRAAAIVGAANAEAYRLVDAARDAAADVFQTGEARLLAAVSAFVEGSNILRREMARIEKDATNWRDPARHPSSTG